MIRFFAQITPDDLNLPQGNLNNSAVQTVFQIVFAIAAVVALIVLLLASLKYITSRGDPQGVAKAKNTIIYAAIGLIISASAFTIVGFVVNRI